jgi:hypothetical protein
MNRSPILTPAMDEAPSRAERRDSSRKRNRLLLGIGGVVVVLAIIAAAIALAGGGSDNTTKAAGAASTTAAPQTNVSLQLGDVSAASAGPPAQLTPQQSQAVLAVINSYLTTATVDPLRSAKPAGDLSTLFGAGALAQVTGPDRAVMVDEGLPKVTGNLDVTSQPVTVVGLADQTGAIVLATASIDLDIEGVTKVKGPPLRILRKGDLVLTPDATGAWKVTAFNVAVARTGAGIDPTTTTAPPPTTTKKGSK